VKCPQLSVSLHVLLHRAPKVEVLVANVARELVVFNSALLQLFCSSYKNRNHCVSPKKVLVGFGLFRDKQLLVGEALHHHLKYPPSVDASAQVPLHRGHGGKQFLARQALFSGFWFPVSSETGNLVSVEKDSRSYSYAVLIV
jgi:hypothetical protein